MHNRLGQWPPQKINILCLGAHADDIEIGCGGTILRLLGSIKQTEVTWIVFSGSAIRKQEALKSAGRFLHAAIRRIVQVKSFRESYFPYQGEAIKRNFDALKRICDPDIIFTHYRHDLHQDHRLINELTWNTFRNHMILEYEIPKYDGDLGIPNTFVQLEKKYCEEKVRHITECFQSQQSRQWFDADTFWALLRLRGLESGSAPRYAEAFHGRKLVW